MDTISQYFTSVTFLKLIEALGTTAFAVSGVRLAAAKEFDWFGALSVGIITAIGGGTVRDLLLGITPFWMLDPTYMLCSLIGFVIVLIFTKQLVRLDLPFFIFDTIGLAFFVVVGVEKTLAQNCPFWLAVVMGTITGIVGGVLRDIIINEEPLFFRKEIYALACIIGALFYGFCYKLHLSSIVCELTAATIIVLTRIFAVKYKWELPQLKDNNVRK